MQQFPCILSDTLAENLRIAKPDASDAMLQAVLRQVGLGYLGDLKQWLGDHGRPLSGGEQKRLGLARAVLSDATYLLLDEPFEALDQANICKVTGLINTLAMDKCVVVATHIVPSALAYQQQIALEPDAATPVVALI